MVSNDRPGLLAELTAALSLHRYNVDSAQLYTRKREGMCDEAFDIFAVTQPGLGIEQDLEANIAELSRTIQELIDGSNSAERILGRRAKAPTWARSEYPASRPKSASTTTPPAATTVRTSTPKIVLSCSTRSPARCTSTA